MKFKKLLIGIFIVTAAVCSGGSVPFSWNFHTNYQKTSQLVVKNASKLKERKSKESTEQPKTVLLYESTTKLVRRFKSFPPRASPFV